jgi:hypothetical protein
MSIGVMEDEQGYYNHEEEKYLSEHYYERIMKEFFKLK